MSAKVPPKNAPKNPALKRPVRTRAADPVPVVPQPAPVAAPAVVAPAAAPVVADAQPAAATDAAPVDTPAQPAAPATAHNKPTGIIAARIHKALATAGLNASVSERLAELKPRVKSYNDAAEALKSGKIKVASAEDPKKRVERDITDAERTAFTATVDSMKATHDADVELVSRLSGCKFRFSSEVDEALAEICDWMVKDLALHAKNHAKKESPSRVSVDSLYSSGLESCASFGLIAGTTLYRTTHANLRSQRTAEAHSKALSTALTTQERDLKKKWREAGLLNKMPRKKEVAEQVLPAAAQPAAAAPAADATPAVAEPAAAAPVAQPAEPVAAEAAPAKVFNHYVAILIDAAGDKADYPGLRKANDLVVHLSDLVSQFINRVVTQLSLIMRLTEAKTITLDHIMCVVHGFLVDGLTPVSTITQSETMVPEKAALSVEQAKRKAEKDAGRVYKINYEALPKIAGMSSSLAISFQSGGYDSVSSICEKHRKPVKK